MKTRDKVISLWTCNFPKLINDFDLAWEHPDKFGLKKTEDVVENAFFEEAQVEHRGGKLMTCVDNDYPRQLNQMPNKPWVIKYLGKFPSEQSFAVVGSRKASSARLEMVEEIVQRFPVTYNVISGGAYGIDTKAHIAALNTAHRTTVVNPGVFKSLYPSKNIPLFRDIYRNKGCIISLFPEKSSINRNKFLFRNKVIVHLSGSIVVIAADRRSGSWSTGNYALNMNKQLFCVPGTPGCDELLSRGAKQI